jgi:hypothetical protein
MTSFNNNNNNPNTPVYVPSPQDLAFASRVLLHNNNTNNTAMIIEGQQQNPDHHHHNNPDQQQQLLRVVFTKDLQQSQVALIEVINNNKQPELSATTSNNKYFLKKTCIATLQQRSPRNPDTKWRVTLNSFKNEHAFLQYAVPKLLDAGLATPKVFGLEFTPSSEFPHDEFKGEFRSLTEFLPIGGPEIEEVRFVNHTRQLYQVLDYLADFHFLARFPMTTTSTTLSSSTSSWIDPNSVPTNQVLLFPTLWHHGGWWRKSLRPTVDFNKIPPAFERLRTQFPHEFNHPRFENCQKLVQKIAEFSKTDRFLHLSGSATTFILGDVKPTNFFFIKNSMQVSMIDFQWVGPASTGAADVVYLLFGGTQFPNGQSFSNVTGVTSSLSSSSSSSIAITTTTTTTATITASSPGSNNSSTTTPSSSSHDESNTIIDMNMFFESCSSIVRQAKIFYLEKLSSHPWEVDENEFEADWDLQLLDYWSTALPYLLSEITPKIAKKNTLKYGYLAYEEQPRVLAYFAFEALNAMDRVLKRDCWE